MSRPIAACLLILAAWYLVPYVQRGWVPLDEGMIGQSAERVLTGSRPHVDYEEAYPGGLSYLYAIVFRFAGIDVSHLRWTVYAAALATLGLTYLVLRQVLTPVAAAVGTWVALTWSFPNYFSSLPSWWILLCAIACLWALMRHLDTGRAEFVVAAGLAAGAAATIKQTGVYLLPPLVMVLLLSPHRQSGTSDRPAVDAAARLVIALAAVGFVIALLRSGLGSGELLYLLAPVAACSAAFLLAPRWTGGGLQWRTATIGLAAAAAPVVLLLVPHLADGTAGAFLHGVFVLPQQRLQFTSLPMRPATQIVSVAALAWLLWTPGSLKPVEARVLHAARWVFALALPLLALRWIVAYTIIWEAVRGAAALLPPLMLWLLLARRVETVSRRHVMFAASAMLAWVSLGQFPFAAPVYFLYVAPLALLAGVMTLRATLPRDRLVAGPTVALVLLFAVIGLNREYVWNVGWFHEVHALETPLNLRRASLRVADFEARVYQRVVHLVEQHAGDGGLVAGPDTPEIYFLTGHMNRSGRLFEFFSGGDSDARTLASWRAADVIVLFHDERFSPPLPPSVISTLRTEYPHGEAVPPFEVRWR